MRRDNRTMSYVTATYHIVINTRHRQMTLPLEACEELYRYISGIVESNGCKLYAINGIENHIHLLIDLSPSLPLAKLMQEVKGSSSKWLKSSPQFPQFVGWGKEYAAFSYAARDRGMVCNYIANQRDHHKHRTFEQEYRHLMENVGIPWNEPYMLT